MAEYEVQGNVLRGKEDTEANKSQGTSGIIGVTDMEKELCQNNVYRGYNVSYRPCCHSISLLLLLEALSYHPSDNPLRHEFLSSLFTCEN